MELKREDCTYTSCYCEENVWCLCDSIKSKIPGAIQNGYCVFISNERRADYHVIFLYKPPESTTIVYDLDTTLTFPCDFGTYYTESIKDESCIKPQYHRMFRVIPAEEFLQTFASDRSHMLTPKGHWKSPPPIYPPIKTKGIDANTMVSEIEKKNAPTTYKNLYPWTKIITEMFSVWMTFWIGFLSVTKLIIFNKEIERLLLVKYMFQSVLPKDVTHI